MKWKKLFIIVTVISTIFCTAVNVYASNEYEYNDVQIYVSNVYRGTVALRSSSVIPSGTITHFSINVNNNGELVLKMNTGDYVYSGINVGSVSNILGTFLGQQLNIVYTNTAYNVFYTYTDSTVYEPIKLYINSGSIVLDTPILSVNGAKLVWNSVTNATAYNIKFSHDGTTYNTIVTNYTSTYYVFSQSGYYSVQAVAPGTNFTGSTWSDSISVQTSSDNDINLLEWLTSNLGAFASQVKDLWSGVGGLFTSIADLFTSTLNALPVQVQHPLYSALVISLVIGLIKRT